MIDDLKKQIVDKDHIIAQLNHQNKEQYTNYKNKMAEAKVQRDKDIATMRAANIKIRELQNQAIGLRALAQAGVSGMDVATTSHEQAHHHIDGPVEAAPAAPSRFDPLAFTASKNGGVHRAKYRYLGCQHGVWVGRVGASCWS